MISDVPDFFGGMESIFLLASVPTNYVLSHNLTAIKSILIISYIIYHLLKKKKLLSIKCRYGFLSVVFYDSPLITIELNCYGKR